MYRESQNSSMETKQPFWQNAFDHFVEKFIKNKTSLFLEKEIKFNNDIVNNCIGLLEGATTMKGLHSKLKEKQNDNNYVIFYSLLWHCYYIMYIMGPTSKKFLPKLRPTELSVKEKKDGIKLFIDEYASTKQIFSSEPIRPFRCLLHILEILWEKGSQDQNLIRDRIINILLTDKENFWKDKSKDFDDRIKNILIYLCAPDKYVPIISQTHKNNILKNVSFLIEENSQVSDEVKIKAIGDALKIIVEQPQQAPTDPHKGNSFYDSKIRPFWDTPTISMNADKEGKLPLNTLLTFKKAIILYGPPGTSKTYTARELAKSVISIEFAKKMKDEENSNDKNEKIKEFLNNEEIIFGESENAVGGNQTVLSHIHRLQLHPNYSYDDFIVGKTIRNNNVDIQKGYLLNLIDKINQDKSKFADLPHIVILDEINRVDISRVFGELFTAMESEYRKDGVELPASIITKNDGTKTNPLKLKVPMNLYFIGTMNMIDFSLEQVDFALRRRFAWVESTFDKDRLKVIINEKGNESSEVVNIDDFVSSCVALNNVIGNRLGEEYWIGHTFFAEIVDIRKETKLDLSKAKEFLWNISIKPMIEAYCGSMDNGGKKSFVQDCEKAFFPKGDNRQDETNA